MQLILQSQIMGDVVVIHCQGHIVFGDEVRTLQREVEKLTHVRKNVVLQLAEVSYVDSGGLGALVRLRNLLRFDGGDLKLCQLSPFVLQVLTATKLQLACSTRMNRRKRQLKHFLGRWHLPKRHLEHRQRESFASTVPMTY